MTYRVRDIERLTGIMRSTLLAWERRYQVVEPKRSDNGYRLYTDEDLVTLRQVKALVDAGRRVGDAVREVRNQLAPVVSTEPSSYEDVRKALQAALLEYDRLRAERIRESLFMHSYQVLVREIYGPILYDTGALWAKGEINVAQEHFVSAFCREHLVAMFQRVASRRIGGPVAVLAGYPGEFHELGLLMVAIEMSLAGWNVTYLGSNTPTPAVATAARDVEAHVVCQSKVLRIPRTQIEEHARTLSKMLPMGTVLVIGGIAVKTLADRSSDRIWYCQGLTEFYARWKDRPVG